MSDGPHRTLPMRQRWKTVALRAQIETFSRVEVAETLLAAIASDWSSEVRQPFVRLVASDLGWTDQVSFFANDPGAFARLRAEARSSLESLLVDCALDAARRGMAGSNAMMDAVFSCLEERALRGSRQVEEHYLRKHHSGAARVAKRIEDAIAHANLTELARSITADAPVGSHKAPAKRDGIEDGVKL